MVRQLAGAVVILAVALSGTGCEDGSAATEGATSATTTTPHVRQGAPVTVGNLRVTVDDHFVLREIGEPDRLFRYHKPRGIWFVVVMEVENASNGPQHFDGAYCHLLVDGREYQSDTSASEDISGDTRASTFLNPGFSQKVVVAFDVPEGIFPPKQRPVQVEVKPQIDADPVLVTLTSGD
ncbi:DUF4352 domain-containing protein [Mycolicibacterium goodii]|uniref:DUF4352 domain-containing protein n=1 Tax=Mycolicibacterium goodii TaxID=134601 RepID=UPI001BDBB42A|nr:DUF4352 domain-containing protein [Mycolicibacterium goodii]MBU8819719.1 DUF4352 domain-containing protein [Mycolicibacterium goodii]MBU8833580.1 DUF4352 domain-containing protein [Mycolicibacterium goodii]